MAPDRQPECLDLETLAAMADGRLSTEGREVVEAHVAGCDRCYELLTEALRDRTERRSPQRLPSAGIRKVPRLVLLAASLLAAAGLGWTSWRIWQDPDRAAGREIRLLANGPGPSRPSLGRLASSNTWVAPPEVVRGADAGSPSRTVREALIRVEGLVERRRTSSTLHSLALGQLAAGDLDSSVGTFKEAIAAGPASAAIRIDAAAAFLERWRRFSRPLDAMEALDHASAALQADVGNHAAMFNYALALEAVGPQSAAARAWQEFLKVDSTSPWADEARRRQERLKTAKSGDLPDGDLTDADPTLLYRYLEQTALPAWARAVLAGEPHDLTKAVTVTDELRRSGRDRELPDLIGLVRASTSWPAHRRNCLAEGVLAVTEWQNRFDAGRIADAGAAVDRGRRSLACAGAPMLNVELGRRLVDLADSRNENAVAGIEEVSAAAVAAGYFRLATRLAQVRGIRALRAVGFSAGIEFHTSGLTQATRSGDARLIALANAYLANAYDEAGDEAMAWDHRHAAISLLDRARTFRASYNTLGTAAVDAADRSHPGASLAFARELEVQVAEWTSPAGFILARLVAARALSQLGRRADAEAALGAAAERVQAIPDATARAEFEAEVEITTGRVFLKPDPQRAVRALTNGIAFLDRVQNRFRTALLLLLRGRALKAVGREADAEKDWIRGIALIEDERQAQKNEQLRVSRFSEVWELFDELTMLYVTSPEKALEVVERGHARDLMDAIGQRQARAPLRAGEFKGWLPSDMLAIVYASLPHALLIWRVSRDDVDLVVRPVSARRLEELVDDHVRALERGDPDDGRLAREILPVELGAAGTRRLAFSPDGALHRVSFPGLRVGAGEFLVQKSVPAITPSLGFLRGGLAQREGPREPVVLLVGGAQSPSEGLPALPGAKREISALVRQDYYPGAVVLRDVDASWARIKQELPRADLVHFAGHAISDPVLPARSRLFVGGADALEAVTASDISSVVLRSGALVILSACETARGRVFRGEGALSLSRPFLTAGAGTVVGSLWRVGDDASALLFDEFYERLREGRGPASALAASQRRMIDAGASPRSWAAFAAVGMAAEWR